MRVLPRYRGEESRCRAGRCGDGPVSPAGSTASRECLREHPTRRSRNQTPVANLGSAGPDGRGRPAGCRTGGRGGACRFAGQIREGRADTAARVRDAGELEPHLGAWECARERQAVEVPQVPDGVCRPDHPLRHPGIGNRRAVYAGALDFSAAFVVGAAPLLKIGRAGCAGSRARNLRARGRGRLLRSRRRRGRARSRRRRESRSRAGRAPAARRSGRGERA